MLMTTRHPVWSVFFCSNILLTAKVMFRYLALYFWLSLLYPYVVFLRHLGSTHIPWLCSFTLLDTAYPISFLYLHPCFCSVVFASTHGFVLSCSVRPNPMPFTLLTLHSFPPFCQKLLFCLLVPLLPCLAYGSFCYTDLWWLCQIHN
jgi:hypothetical protein